MKVSIIGMGNVGATIAYTTVMKGLARELILVSRNLEKAKADATDLMHSQVFTEHSLKILAGGIETTTGSQVVIITASIPWNPSFKSRFDLAPGNIALMQQIIPELVEKNPEAVFIVITNPVDIITYFVLKTSGLPASKVMGVGTLIDSARFREYLSIDAGIHPDDIRAYILGEHGDSQFPAFSIAYAGGERISAESYSMEAFSKTSHSGYEIVKGKGYSNFGISMATSLILESIYLDNSRTIPVSTLVDQYLGIEEVCLSLPAVIGRNGIKRILHPDLNEKEQAALIKSANLIRKVIKEHL